MTNPLPFQPEFAILDQPEFAVLDKQSGLVIPCEMGEWAQSLEKNRVIQQDYLVGDTFFLSTVFLGLNHQFNPFGPPLWFETILFGPKVKRDWFKGDSHPWYRDEIDAWRYTTLDQARKGHSEALEWLSERTDLSGDYQLCLA